MSQPKKPSTKPSLPPFEQAATPYSGISRERIISLRKQFVNPTVATYYKNPLMIVEGAMQYVFDETGRRYLDAFAGIATISVGHCHPHIVKAVQTQTATLQHATTLYLHPTIAEYSQMLASRMPDPLSVVYLVNSGSEANDLAMLMARLYTENFDLITLRNGYHGLSGTSMGLTSQSLWKFPIPHSLGIHHALNADPYRGPWQGNTPATANHYANEIRDIIRHATSGRIAGFIAESIQGVGGTVVYPDGYLKKVSEYVHEAGGLVITDEVQTGFCRTGRSFWGFQSQGIQPDIVTLAKGIGNGVPLAAVVTTPEIAQVFTDKIHFSTFAGNPVACAAAKAVLETLEYDNLQANCHKVGTYLMDGLRQLQEHHEAIGDIRGAGLMIGVDLVEDRETKKPASELASAVHELSKDLGLLIGKGGMGRNVLRIKPPLCISITDADFILQVLDDALEMLA